MIPYTPPKAVTALPVIDLSLLHSPHEVHHQRLAAEIRSACLDTGFFYVKNHGLDEAVVQRQYALSRTLFGLPAAGKQALLQARSPARRGYEASAAQVLDEGSPPDLKESFRYGRDPAPGNPYAGRGLPTYGPSQWPVEPAGLGEAMAPYYDAMVAVGRDLMAALALSLELPRDYFDRFYTWPMATVRLLKYPPMAPDAADNQIGAGAHTDWGGITVLSQDGVGGLEVRNVDGDWVQAPPIPGTLIINLGELMARWTNDRYRSNLHRVRNNTQATDRYSIAFFFDPEYDARIDCIPSCIAPGEERRFATCTAGEHIAHMHHRTTSTAAVA